MGSPVLATGIIMSREVSVENRFKKKNKKRDINSSKVSVVHSSLTPS